MHGAGAESLDGLDVGLATVALVLGEAVAGVAAVKGDHEAVAEGFGHD